MQHDLTLVRSGVVSAEDYVEALTRREEERPPLGQVAIEEGALAARQVLEVLRSQQANSDRLFGELAIEKGYLVPEQVAMLLMHQQSRQRPVVDHLVELGRLSLEEAEAARREQRRRRMTETVHQPA